MVNSSSVLCPACAGTAFRPFGKKGAFRYLRCQSCGLAAIDPMPSEQMIEAHYRRKFEGGNYATIREFATEYLAIYRQYLHWMKRLTRVESARLLDIGCFTGEFLQVLLEEGGADAFGVELQAEAVEIAQARWPGRVFRHNIDHPLSELPDGSLDIVTLMALIEHVQEPGHLLRRVRALLKPEGWLFLETPNASSWPAKLTGRFWPPLAPVEHLFLFSRGAIVRCLEQAGFRVVEIAPHVKHLPLAYVYDMLQHFGPQWRKVLAPAFHVLPKAVQRMTAPFYVGEMLVAARAT